VSGDGFPDCQRPGTVPISIKLNNITSSRDPEILVFSDDWLVEFMGIAEDEWRAESPDNLYFSLDCDGKNVFAVYVEKEMAGQRETMRVRDGANCTLVTRRIPEENIGSQSTFDVFDKDPIWSIDYTITNLYIKSNREMEIEISSEHNKGKEGENFKVIPTCYLDKLQFHTNLSSIYPAVGPSNEAIDWLVDNDEQNSECQDRNFIERYALASLFFTMNISEELREVEKQCTWPTVVCDEGNITKIKLKGYQKDNISSIPSEVALLTALQTFYLSDNLITSVPSEIGLLTGLEELDLSGNQITSIPSEIGLLTGLEDLYLDYNEITSIPSEIGLLTGLEDLTLYNNQITSIPSEIGLLTGLEDLSLDNNEITVRSRTLQ